RAGVLGFLSCPHSGDTQCAADWTGGGESGARDQVEQAASLGATRGLGVAHRPHLSLLGLRALKLARLSDNLAAAARACELGAEGRGGRALCAPQGFAFPPH